MRLRERGRRADREALDGAVRAERPVVRRTHEQPVEPRAGSSGSSAGPASATAAGCVAFGIGTETQGSIVSPARACGLSALRPTFGRVSRHGGMVLAWSQDRVGPICRTVEDCAMVFNAIHGVDEKDPSTVTTPFQFDRDLKLASLRIGVDANAPKEFVDGCASSAACRSAIGARPTVPGIGWRRAERRVRGGVRRLRAAQGEGDRARPRQPAARRARRRRTGTGRAGGTLRPHRAHPRIRWRRPTGTRAS